jgi:hypothetical protein
MSPSAVITSALNDVPAVLKAPFVIPAPKISSFADVVVAEPLFTTALLPLVPLAPAVTSKGEVVFSPLYSRIRTSGKAAASLNVTVTLLLAAKMFLA